MSKMTAVIRKALSVILMVTVGSSYCLITGTAFAQISPKLVGQLSVRGTVTLNGVNATSGATVFSGGLIKTGANGSAIISLGKMGQVDLEPDTELTLRLDAGIIDGHLRSGRVTISAPTGIAVSLATVDGVAVADGKQASVLTVDMKSGNTRVASVRSEARVTSGNRVEVAAAGQEVSVGTQSVGQTCYCYNSKKEVTGKGKIDDKGVCKCTEAISATVTGGLTTGALLTLAIIGVGGSIAGIVTAVQGDTKVAGGSFVLSAFR